jgi:hypothetical protein
MRQIRMNDKWVNGIPTEAGQRYRYSYGAGWAYGVYIPEPDSSMKITRLSFKQRFTSEERIAIRAAAETVPLVYDFNDLVNSATYIDLSRPDTINAVNALEAMALIGEGRAIEILSPPIDEDERWQG